MTVTKIFIETIFLDYFRENIFGDFKFFSKMHFSRENRENVIPSSPFDRNGQGAGGGRTDGAKRGDGADG